MKLSNKYLPLVLCLLFSTNVTAGLFDKMTGGEKPQRVELTEGSDKAAIFKQAFSEDSAFIAAVKPAEFAVRKVAISSFQVEFVTQQTGSGAGSGGGSGGGSVEKTFTLKGATDEQMVAITEKLHQQFKELLKQRGYEVLPADALINSSFKNELTNADGTPIRADEKDSVLGSARSKGLIGRDTGDSHGASVTVTAQGTAPKVFALKYGIPSSMKLANELGIAVIQARMQVNFMQIDSSNTALLSVAETEGKPRNMLAATGSQISVFWPNSKAAYFAVKKSVSLPGSAASEVTKLEMTGGDKTAVAGKVALNVIGGLLGFSNGGGLGATAASVAGSGKFEVTASADYEQKLSQDLGLVLGLYAEALPK